MEQPELIPGTGEQITDLAPTDSTAKRVGIRVGQKRFAILSSEEVGDLRLTVGQAWTGQLQGNVLEAVERDKARAAALRLVARAGKSKAEILSRLTDRGFDEVVVETVIASLERAGVVDDEALARQIVEHETRRGAGAMLLEAKLAKRGIAAQVACEAVRAGLDGHNQAEKATALARRRAATFPTNLSPEAAAGRLFGWLSRRGFGQEEADEAIRAVIRELPPPD